MSPELVGKSLGKHRRDDGSKVREKQNGSNRFSVEDEGDGDVEREGDGDAEVMKEGEGDGEDGGEEGERVDEGAWLAAAPPDCTPILMVLHVDVHGITPEVLCQLFGLYGDVLKVKLVYPRGMALVQMRYPHQAMNAQRLLDQAPLCGMTLEVKSSSQWSINDPKATDFNSAKALHRYSDVQSPDDICYRESLAPPCPTLVIDNLSPDCSVEEVTKLLEKALAHMEADGRVGAVEAAVHALVMTHNLEHRGRRLSVTFLSGERHTDEK
ncbi:unnamed protein product [Choristocarpus tenellus]